MNRIAFPLVLFTLAVTTVNAQDQMGIAHDNYAVTNGILLNPTAIVDSRPWLEVNLVGASIFARNNYISTPKSLLFKGQAQPIYDPSGQNMNGILSASIHGPSASLNWGIHGFAITTRMRNYVNVRKMPGRLVKMAFDGLGYSEDDNGIHEQNNARLKAMGWAEFGFSYGRILHQFDKDMWSGAVTVKRLIGVYNTAMIVDNVRVEVLSEDQMITHNLEGRYANTTPAWGAGKGWGVDLGLNYKRMLEDVTKYIPHSEKTHCMKPDYKFKVGVSLLDVGGIRYRNQAETRSFSESTDVQDVNNLEELINATGDPDATAYNAGLPTALSAQFDYNFENGFFVNGTMIHGMPRPKNFGVERTHTLAVTPRFERKYFGVSLPVSMYNYTTPHVGLGLRIANVVIGSDHILPWLVNKNLKSADIYFNLKYTIYNGAKCKNKKTRYKTKFCPAPGF